MKSQANGLEYGELARALDELAQRAPAIDAAELVSLWPKVESRVLARVRADEYEGGALGGVGERVRNLAWEIGVSVDLYAVHLGAVRTLAKLLREHAQWVERQRTARASGERTSQPGSNAS